FDPLVAVEPHGAPLGSGLDALAIDTAGRGLGLAPLPPALPLPQLCHQAGPQAGTPPGAEVPIDGIPMPEVDGQHAPLAARLGDIENPIEDAPQLIGRAARPPWAPFRFRQKGR